MANYKRGKCRYKGCGNRDTETFWRARRGLKPIKVDRTLWRSDFNAWQRLWGFYSFTSSDPRWHDIIHHRRPRRHEESRIARLIVKGEIDEDAAIWPLNKKPRIYYW